MVSRDTKKGVIFFSFVGALVTVADEAIRQRYIFKPEDVLAPRLTHEKLIVGFASIGAIVAISLLGEK